MFGEGVTQDAAARLDIDVEQALDPVEPAGTFRDTRECAALALLGDLLLSPPTARPGKRG